MTTIVTRTGVGGKGSPLTNTEVDTNFSNLNTDKLELGQAQSSATANSVLFFNGSKVLSAGSGLTYDASGRFALGTSTVSSEGIMTIGTQTATDKNGIVMNRGSAPSVTATQVGIANLLNGIGTSEALLMRSPGGFLWQKNDGSTEWMRLVGSTGNLLIGTTDSVSKLTVNGDAIFGAINTPRTRFTSIGTSGVPTIRYDDNGYGQIVMQNLGITAANQGFRLSAQFSNDGANNYDAGYIGFLTESSYTSTASTRDSCITLATVLDGAMSEKVRVTSAGRVGVNTQNPGSVLEVIGASSVDTTGGFGTWTLRLRDTTATAASGTGSSLLFQGIKATGGGVGNYAAIAGLKENGTNNNEDGYLAFYTVPNSTGLITERARITSSGNFLLGTTDTFTSGSAYAQLITPSLLIAPVLGVDQTAFATGAYQPTYGGAWKHRGGYLASLYQQANGGHSWFVNASTDSGTGSDVSFSQAMLLTNGGNLGIGTSSPQAKLHIRDGATEDVSGSTIRMDLSGINPFWEFRATNGGTSDNRKLSFYTNALGGSDVISLTQAGNVGIGVSSPSAKLDAVGSRLLWRMPSSGGVSSAMNADSVNSVIGISAPFGQNPNSVSNAGARWGITFTGNGDNPTNIGGAKSASLFAVSEDALGYNRTVGLAFHVSSFDGLQTERMRLDGNGNLLVGTTSFGTSAVGFVVNGNTGSSARGACISVLAGSTNSTTTYEAFSTGANAYRFYVGMGGTIFATSTSISAISDRTLKENIRDLETGLSEVMALKPRRFDWKNGDAQNVAGFVAQEVEEVLPELVTDYRYNKDEDGNDIIKKSLKMGDILPTLVKAIQEQQAIIDAQQAALTALTARVAALESSALQ